MLNASVDLAVPKSSWPLGCPWHDLAGPISPTAHANFSPPSSPQCLIAQWMLRCLQNTLVN